MNTPEDHERATHEADMAPVRGELGPLRVARIEEGIHGAYVEAARGALLRDSENMGRAEKEIEPEEPKKEPPCSPLSMVEFEEEKSDG